MVVSSEPNVIKLPGAFWLVYSVCIQLALLSVAEMRASSIRPSMFVPPFLLRDLFKADQHAAVEQVRSLGSDVDPVRDDHSAEPVDEVVIVAVQLALREAIARYGSAQRIARPCIER